MICLNSKHNLLCGIRAAINSEIVLLQIKALRLKKKSELRRVPLMQKKMKCYTSRSLYSLSGHDADSVRSQTVAAVQQN